MLLEKEQKMVCVTQQIQIGAEIKCLQPKILDDSFIFSAGRIKGGGGMAREPTKPDSCLCLFDLRFRGTRGCNV